MYLQREVLTAIIIFCFMSLMQITIATAVVVKFLIFNQFCSTYRANTQPIVKLFRLCAVERKMLK